MAGSDLTKLSERVDFGRPWFYFDPHFYSAQCIERSISPPIDSTSGLLKHYLDRGARFGLSPNPLFDEEYYRRRYRDVAAEVQSGRLHSGFDHFQRVGVYAGASAAWFFDGEFYRNAHEDLTDDNLQFSGFLDRYTHFLMVGITERRPAHWTVQALLTTMPNAAFPANREQLCALLTGGTQLPALFSPVFEYEWMREKYDWGRSVPPGSFMRHYLLNVRAQKLSPSPYFDEKFYLSAEPEVATAVEEGGFSCAYEHFILHGVGEWRRPFGAFDANYYFATHMADTPAAGQPLTPFAHFLLTGRSRRLRFSPPLATLEVPEDLGKALYERRCALNAGRLGDVKLAPKAAVPDVSVILIARDNFQQTANAIVSAVCNTHARLEIIVFDNGSVDETTDLPSIHPGIRYLRAETNLGFTVAVNRAAGIATGRMLLLLNNDVEVMPGAIDGALKALEQDRSIGALGAKILRMHGKLQEAGSLIWANGTCLGYARDSDPQDGQVGFARDVDFCSGCFLAVMRQVWNEIGGFDEAYAPAYYEDTDLCARLWESGKRVVYDPRIVIWHYEYGSSAIAEEALTLMRRNQRLFAARHKAFLSRCLPPASNHIERARLRHMRGPRVLFIEDWLPDPAKGMGFTRSAHVAQVLSQVAGFVSMLGLHENKWPASLAGDQEARRVEILTGVNVVNFLGFMRARIGVYDLVWLSRTHNLPRLKEWRNTCPEFFANTRVVLDTEAIAATRRFSYAQQVDNPVDLGDLVMAEMEHVDGADHLCAVNEADRQLLLDLLRRCDLSRPVSVLGHALRVQPTLPRFAETADIVLLGAYSEKDSPNADALLWFDRCIRPLLGKLPGVRYVVAGSAAAKFVQDAGLQHEYHVVSDPASVGEVLRTARVMVAPTRFAAGIPMKVHEAAGYGVPVVMTELLARQLGWAREGIAYAPIDPAAIAKAITALMRDARAWQRCQALQAELVTADCNPAHVEQTIRAIVSPDTPVANVVDVKLPRLPEKKASVATFRPAPDKTMARRERRR